MPPRSECPPARSKAGPLSGRFEEPWVAGLGPGVLQAFMSWDSEALGGCETLSSDAGWFWEPSSGALILTWCSDLARRLSSAEVQQAS